MLTEEEFLFGAEKPVFLGMFRFCFLSVVSKENVTFWIYLLDLSLNPSTCSMFTTVVMLTKERHGEYKKV